MGLMIKIIEIHGREILDSRGNPTVEVEVSAARGQLIIDSVLDELVKICDKEF